LETYKKNIVTNFITQIVKIVLGFITSILIARVLGADGKGYASYAILIFGLLGDFGHLGINNATTFFQKKSEYDEKTVFDTNMTYLLIAWIILSIVIIVLKMFDVFLNDYGIFFIIFGLLSVLITFILTCVNSFYIGNERIYEANEYVLISSVIYFLIIIIIFFLRLLDAYSFFALQIFAPLFNTIMLIKNTNFKFKPAIRHDLLKREFRYGIIIYFSALFIYLNYRIDQIIIKNMIGNADLGIYSIGVTLSELLFLIPDSVTTALLGRLCNIDNLIDKKKITTATVKYTLYISLMLCFVGILMTPLIPIVYGKQYIRSIDVTIILFAGIIFASMGKVSYSYFFTEGRPKIHLLITFMTLIINVIFNLILIPKIGIDGSALASTISYTVYGIAYIIFLVKKEGFKLQQFFLFDDYDKRIIKQIIKPEITIFKG
jgi:O-antigen/teichoic acid export membrane protein